MVPAAIQGVHSGRFVNLNPWSFDMNHLKQYPAHLLLYVIGAVDFLSQVPALGVLAPYAPWITVAGTLSAALHHSYKSGAASAVTQAVAGAPAKLMLVALMLGSLLGVGALSGCTTLPTPSQDAAVTAAVTIATGVAIQQHDTAESGKWQARAKEIKLIALELKQVNDAGDATLQTLATDLQPQIQKLGPADVLAVNALVATLTPILQDQIAKNPKVGNTQVAVDTILTAVLTVCAAYGV